MCFNFVLNMKSMKHTYKITGMTCMGCKSHVEKALNDTEGVINAEVNLEKAEAVIEMDKHLQVAELQKGLTKAGGNYHIHSNEEDAKKHEHKQQAQKPEANGNGIYYCPMHCEGDKIYNKPGDCPVCGMDLVEQPSAVKNTIYTCPMHPEIEKNEPGSCAICGMDLVPKQVDDSPEVKTYKKLLKKFIVATIFTFPI